MILVTGASGGLAGLVVERLAASGAPFAVGTRNPDRVPAGVPVRPLDFDDPATLPDAFRGVDVVLLVSAGWGEEDTVLARHGAAIDAAEAAGVRHIVYTSLSAAGDHLGYALPHRWTERRLADGSAAWTFLRNGLYAELLVPDVLAAVSAGVVTAPLGAGRLAAVSREDLAEVAAKVLAEIDAGLAAGNPSVHAGKAYELVGDRAVGGAELAAAATELRGAPVEYRPGTLAKARAGFVATGAPLFQVDMQVSTYSVIAGGFLGATGTELPALLGSTPRPALDVIVKTARAAFGRRPNVGPRSATSRARSGG